jgi:hypothetical protein
VFEDTHFILRGHWKIPLVLLLIILTLLVTSLDFYPALTPILAFASALLLLLFLNPIAGVYIWLFLFPIQEIYFRVSVYGHAHAHETHFVELFALIILPVLIAQALKRWTQNLAQPPVPSEFQWIYFVSAAFVCWSVINLLLSPLPTEITINWWVMMCNFPLSIFLIFNMNSYEKFVRLVIFFCIVAALQSVATICSNLYTYDYRTLFTDTSPFTIILIRRFMKSGLSPASGFSGRHELGILLSCATACNLFLMHRFKGLAARAGLLLLLLLYATTLFLAIPKAAILGCAISLFIVILAVPQWRKRAPISAAAMFGMGFLGNYLAIFIRPSFVSQHAAGYAGGDLLTQSPTQPGTILNRIKLMKEAIDVIVSSNGLGAGPDSMQYLKIGGVHGHDFILTFGADYGVPGILFALCMVLLLGKLAYSKILARPRPENRVWLLRAAILACLLMTLFEYSLDCSIWYPHLWFISALFLASMRLTDDEPHTVLNRS